MSGIVTNYHCMQFQGNRKIQTQENGEKPHFGADVGPLDPNSGRQFFFKNITASVARCHGQLSICKSSEKSHDPILRKFSDGLTNRRTDRQTNESDFIGRCPTDVERPTTNFKKSLGCIENKLNLLQ